MENHKTKSLTQKGRRALFDSMIDAIMQDHATLFCEQIDTLLNAAGEKAGLKILRHKERHEGVVLQYIIKHNAINCFQAIVDKRLMLSSPKLETTTFQPDNTDLILRFSTYLVFYDIPVDTILSFAFKYMPIADIDKLIKSIQHKITRESAKAAFTHSVAHELEVNQNIARTIAIMKQLKWTIDSIFDHHIHLKKNDIYIDIMATVTAKSTLNLDNIFRLYDEQLISYECLSLCLASKSQPHNLSIEYNTEHYATFLAIQLILDKSVSVKFDICSSIFKKTVSTMIEQCGLNKSIEIVKSSELLQNKKAQHAFTYAACYYFHDGKHLTINDRDKIDTIVDNFPDAITHILPILIMEEAFYDIFKDRPEIKLDWSFEKAKSISARILITPNMGRYKSALRHRAELLKTVLNNTSVNGSDVGLILKDDDDFSVWYKTLLYARGEFDKATNMTLLYLTVGKFGLAPIMNELDNFDIINTLLVGYTPLELLTHTKNDRVKRELLTKIQ